MKPDSKKAMIKNATKTKANNAQIPIWDTCQTTQRPFLNFDGQRLNCKNTNGMLMIKIGNAVLDVDSKIANRPYLSRCVCTIEGTERLGPPLGADPHISGPVRQSSAEL